jgi:hypothetical protein
MQARGFWAWWLMIGGSVALAIYLFLNIRNEESWVMVGVWSVYAALCLLGAYQLYLGMERDRMIIEVTETPSL